MKWRKLLMFDGNNLVMRMAASPGLSKMSYHGEPTGAIHGAVKAVLSKIDAYKPDEVAVAFDGLGASAKKRQIYSGFKADRGPMLDSVFGQIEYTRNLLRAAGIFVFHEPGHDADDVIGCIASIPGRSVLLQSNDKDFCQLVNRRTAIIRPDGSLDTLIYKQDVIDRYGIPPSRFAEYLALVGDSVDGIPGLQGCGPKNAVNILREYRSLTEFLEDPPQKWRKAVKKQRKELPAFLALTRINKHVLSEEKLSSIIPRLTPGAYSKQLPTLLAGKNLKSLAAWFAAHPGSVIDKKGGIFDAISAD